MAIPDAEFYQPLFSPWAGFGDFTKFHGRVGDRALVTPDRCYVLYCLARQALNVSGDFWECGVYKGGTAAMLSEIIAQLNLLGSRRLRLFDTFAGMPEPDQDRDLHKRGDFSDTSLESVKDFVGYNNDFIFYHPGYIPDTFRSLEFSKIAFAHVDVDLYKSVLDCCQFIFPRLVPGGFMIFDDYGWPSCPGARAAVDEYFSVTPTAPLVLPTGQAIVFKN